MTNEEAIKRLKEFKILHTDQAGWDTSTLQALDMAIKALEQKSKYRKEARRWKNKALGQQKTGHWIVEEWNNKEHHTCSVCQIVVNYEPCYHYCPYCGAKMVEPQESEEV